MLKKKLMIQLSSTFSSKQNRHEGIKLTTLALKD